MTAYFTPRETHSGTYQEHLEWLGQHDEACGKWMEGGRLVDHEHGRSRVVKESWVDMPKIAEAKHVTTDELWEAFFDDNESTS